MNKGCFFLTEDSRRFYDSSVLMPSKTNIPDLTITTLQSQGSLVLTKRDLSSFRFSSTCVSVFGSSSFVLKLKTLKGDEWKPCCFYDLRAYSCSTYFQYIPSDLLFNSDYGMLPMYEFLRSYIDTIQPSVMFIRSNRPDTVFRGKVFDYNDYSRNLDFFRLSNAISTDDMQNPILISSAKDFFREFISFYVDGVNLLNYELVKSKPTYLERAELEKYDLENINVVASTLMKVDYSNYACCVVKSALEDKQLKIIDINSINTTPLALFPRIHTILKPLMDQAVRLANEAEIKTESKIYSDSQLDNYLTSQEYMSYGY